MRDILYISAAWSIALVAMIFAWNRAGNWRRKHRTLHAVKDPPIQTVFKIPSDCEDQP